MGIKEHLKSLIRRTPIPLRLFQEMRFEAYLFFVRWNNRINPAKLLQKTWLRGLRRFKLHFGCGSRILEGWVNIDGFPAVGIDYVTDLRVALPFSDNSADFIFTEHVLEHLDAEKDTPFILREFHRILSPEGKIRIIVPDVEKFCAAYMKKDAEWFSIACPDFSEPAAALNSVFLSHFHRFVYDYPALSGFLLKAGFQEVSQTAYGESSCPELNVDLREKTRMAQSLCLEARK